MADNNNALNNMQAQTAQLQTNVAQLNSALITLEKLQGDMEDIITTNTKNVKDYTTQISSASDALKTLNDQASKISQAFNSAQSALQQNRAALQQLVQVQVDYSKSQGDSSTRYKN